MTKQYRIKKRKVQHLVEALSQSEFYLYDKKGDKLQIDLKFIEALRRFLFSSKGKNVRRVINAFRNIAPECFSEVKNGETITQKVKEATLGFLSKVLTPKEFKKAQKLLVYKGTGVKKSELPEVTQNILGVFVKGGRTTEKSSLEVINQYPGKDSWVGAH